MLMQMQTLLPEVELRTKTEQATLTALYYYPIKSCAGIQMDEVQIDECGIIHDRELMLVETATNEFLTQRELPRMALIHPHITDGRVKVEAPGMSALEAPLLEEGEKRRVSVWSDKCRAIDQGEEVAQWFSEYLKVDCRLVRMASDFRRRLDTRYAVSKENQVHFADGFPFLLVSQESLDDLNTRLEVPLPMNRFRPNLVISGSGIPFVEDHLQRLTIGEITLDVVKPCARCAITTTDQQTAVTAKEPLKTLATFRRGPGGKVLFGQNVIHSNQGVLQVGDQLKVLEVKEK